MTDKKNVLKEYEKAIRITKNYNYFHASTEIAKKFLSGAKEGEVVLLNVHDKKKVIFKEGFVKDRSILKDFLKLHLYPTVIKNMGVEVSIALDDGERKGIFLFRKDTKHDAEFEKLAHELRSGDYLFYLVDLDSVFNKEIGAFIGVYDSDLPVLQYATNEGERLIYRYEGEFTLPAMKQFIKDCRKGTAKRFYPSQPIPATNPGPIYKVVGKTFQSEVIDNDVDVVLKFYDDYCPYCETLKPIYEKVGKAFNGKVKFCEIDGSVNDVEGKVVSRFPTILIFLNGQKDNPIEYEGELAEDPLLAFIEVQTGILADEVRKEEL